MGKTTSTKQETVDNNNKANFTYMGRFVKREHPLCRAIINKHPNKAENLIIRRRGVRINNNMPLILACKHGNSRIANILMNLFEVDIESPNHEPLKAAVQFGHVDIVRSLLNHPLKQYLTQTGFEQVLQLAEEARGPNRDEIHAMIVKKHADLWAYLLLD